RSRRPRRAPPRARVGPRIPRPRSPRARPRRPRRGRPGPRGRCPRLRSTRSESGGGRAWRRPSRRTRAEARPREL
ncbi:MAG: hypothetical protein E6K14_07160, partial [Methanobacteriota archaeon]